MKKFQLFGTIALGAITGALAGLLVLFIANSGSGHKVKVGDCVLLLLDETGMQVPGQITAVKDTGYVFTYKMNILFTIFQHDYSVPFTQESALTKISCPTK